ncbi:Membrane protein implicated in regulation of membrane protease activity [Paenibacillus sophorae]|nr:NfeD family protein [Paenibacillus sophorae]SEO52476.1 Membrane protein implicated in regulation of membrane protease activity [Paenibacillus sophorae]
MVWIIWFIAAGILLVAEMLTLTFYLLWLCIGAVAAGLVSLAAPGAVLIQVLTGCLVALGLTLFSKPVVSRFRASQGFKDIGTDIVGREGIVVRPIEPGRYGQVKVGGDIWSAASLQQLSVDEKVRVISRGNTIIEVERWEV